MPRIRMTARIASVLNNLETGTKTASLTARLDLIASELERIDPRIALALGRVSNQLIRAQIGRNFSTEERKEFEEILASLKPQGIKALINSLDKWWKKYDEEMDDSERSETQDNFVDAVFPLDFFGNKNLEEFATKVIHYHSIHPLAIKKVLDGFSVTASLDRIASKSVPQCLKKMTDMGISEERAKELLTGYGTYFITKWTPEEIKHWDGEAKTRGFSASLTAALDRVASELELIDPRLALVVDRVSDRLDSDKLEGRGRGPQEIPE